MSAYIVDKNHIIYLVKAAISLNLHDGRAHAFYWFAPSTATPETIENNASPDALAKIATMLWRENIKSVNSRYKDPDDSAAYSITAADIRGANWSTFAPVQVLQSLSCYEYQSCEHEAWPLSDAHAWAAALTKLAAQNVAGLDLAIWGAPEPTKPTGTHDDPIRYEKINAEDPNRKTKLAAQLEQFEKDAGAGKVVCLSDLMSNAGM